MLQPSSGWRMVCWAVLGANRWVLSFDHTQRLLVTPVPRHAAIIDPKNAENRVTIRCG
jgi:hypothetical protein